MVEWITIKLKKKLLNTLENEAKVLQLYQDWCNLQSKIYNNSKRYNESFKIRSEWIKEDLQKLRDLYKYGLEVEKEEYYQTHQPEIRNTEFTHHFCLSEFTSYTKPNETWNEAKKMFGLLGEINPMVNLFELTTYYEY